MTAVVKLAVEDADLREAEEEQHEQHGERRVAHRVDVERADEPQRRNGADPAGRDHDADRPSPRLNDTSVSDGRGAHAIDEDVEVVEDDAHDATCRVSRLVDGGGGDRRRW